MTDEVISIYALVLDHCNHMIIELKELDNVTNGVISTLVIDHCS